jgi:hypothetical protein
VLRLRVRPGNALIAEPGNVRGQFCSTRRHRRRPRQQPPQLGGRAIARKNGPHPRQVGQAVLDVRQGQHNLSKPGGRPGRPPALADGQVLGTVRQASQHVAILHPEPIYAPAENRRQGHRLSDSLLSFHGFFLPAARANSPAAFFRSIVPISWGSRCVP